MATSIIKGKRIGTPESVGYPSGTAFKDAVANYVDALPVGERIHIGFVNRVGAGTIIVIAQKFLDSDYASALCFGYWSTPQYMQKNNGTWTLYPISLGGYLKPYISRLSDLLKGGAWHGSEHHQEAGCVQALLDWRRRIMYNQAKSEHCKFNCLSTFSVSDVRNCRLRIFQYIENWWFFRFKLFWANRKWVSIHERTCLQHLLGSRETANLIVKEVA